MSFPDWSLFTDEELTYWRNHHLGRLENASKLVDLYRRAVRENQSEMIKRGMNIFEDIDG